jgi:hypothetical protein
MNRASQCGVRTLHTMTFAGAWALAACLLAIPSAVRAQSSDSGSLGDIARQVRSQKTSTADPGQAQQIADELSEDQNHADDAPGGFKTYNAGDYTLWVPAPFKVSGHDDAGVVLTGPMVGSKQPFLVVGSPFVLPPGAPDEAFHDAAAHFSNMYTDKATCTLATAGSRSAYECSLAVAQLNGTRVSGNAWLLRSGNTVYPVLCAAPSDSHNRDYLNGNRNGFKENAREGLEHEEQDVRAVWQKCDTAFQSIRPNEQKAQEAGKTPASAGASTVVAANASPAPKQSPAQPTAALQSQASTVPAGFKIHAFNYCKSRNECYDASVLVPAEAKLVSSNCKEYIFETKIQGTAFLLMTGPEGGECDGQSASGPDLVRWSQLVDPENKRAPGTYSTISSQTTKQDGKPAVITTLGFRKGMDSYMGKRIEVENNGVTLVAGCIAARDHFDDGDAVCTAMITSMLLP